MLLQYVGLCTVMLLFMVMLHYMSSRSRPGRGKKTPRPVLVRPGQGNHDPELWMNESDSWPWFFRVRES